MKKLLYISLIIIFFLSCNRDDNYVTFSGKIENQNIDSLIVFHPETNYSKVIKLNKKGEFKDTLKVKNGQFSMTNSKDFTLLYLINGDNLEMSFDANKFDETIVFKGDHSQENNFFAKSTVNETAFFSNTGIMRLNKVDFDNHVSTYITDFKKRLSDDTLDIDFVNHQNKYIDDFKKYIEKEYFEKNYNTIVLGKGKASPKFKNYENFNGDKTSLEDLKGKYVYIDIWATWCNPCKKEIPHLQKIEKEYHNKNIEFVSISLDDERDYNTWKAMVKNMNLTGTQLYAKGDNNFSTEYRVRSIPRFILIDDKGFIVEANAPRPSDQRLRKLLSSLNL